MGVSEAKRRKVPTRPAAKVPAGKDSAARALPPYVGDEKNRFSFVMGEDFVEKHNIAWRVEVAKEDAANPLLEPGLPWESAAVFSHGTVMRDPIDQLWKAWYISVPSHTMSPSAERRLCYAESTDGVSWTRPDLRICSYKGSLKNNILIGIESGGPCQHASVIVHPEGPPDCRYEMFIMRLPGWECAYDVVEGFPLPRNRSSHRDAVFSVGLFRYKSADGKHWVPWEQAKIETSDSGWIIQLADGSYVDYHKSVIPALPGGVFPYDVAAGVCRIMMRRTSKTGSDWSPAELVMTPDWRDAHDTQFMELTPFPQREGYVGLVSVYHTLDQTVDIQFAGSRDGRSWWRPDRRSCFPLRPLGDYGGGMIWPMHPLIHHEGRVYLYYAGCEGLHNDYHSTEPIERMRKAEFPFWPHYYQPLGLGKDVYSPMPGNLWYHSALCRASWESGRLWAAVTASGGNLTGDLLTRQLAAGGKQVAVNVVTLPTGSLEAELTVGGKPIRGFSRSDCTPVQGNHHEVVIRWKGGTRCPSDQVQIRFYIRRTRLYGFDLRTLS